MDRLVNTSPGDPRCPGGQRHAAKGTTKLKGYTKMTTKKHKIITKIHTNTTKRHRMTTEAQNDHKEIQNY